MAHRRARAIVVGGGMAGLAAAWKLARAGHEVRVLERGPNAGGRASSFTEPESGERLDTGQHMMLGCYRATRSWLAALGCAGRVDFGRSLSVDYLLPAGRRLAVRGSMLPPPLGLLGAAWRLPGMSWGDRLRSLGLLQALAPRRSLDESTVSSWLGALGIPAPAREFILEPLALAALNEKPAVASALPFAAVLKRMILAGPGGSGVGLATAGLGDVYVPAAVWEIESRGGIVATGTRAEGLIAGKEGRIAGVRAAGGAELEADTVVCAVAPWDLLPLVSGIPSLAPLAERVRALSPSPIVSVHLWLDRVVLAARFAGLGGAKFNWLFNQTVLLGPGRLSGEHICLVASAAREMLGTNPESLAESALEELRERLPESRGARLVHSRAVWDVKATVALTPGTARLRPGPATAVPGLSLAGDWTDTGLPACLEGAVISGLAAAGRVISSG